jgi:hypothetical protein
VNDSFFIIVLSFNMEKCYINNVSFYNVEQLYSPAKDISSLFLHQQIWLIVDGSIAKNKPYNLIISLTLEYLCNIIKKGKL